jgi:hypothetical protein
MPTIAEQLAEVEWMLRMRRDLFPRFVAEGQMTEAEADRRLRATEAIRDTLLKSGDPR